jgi:hypothetical protein
MINDITLGTSHELSGKFQSVLWCGILLMAGIRFWGVIPYNSGLRVPDYPEAARVGLNLSRSGEWANPFSSRNTGPTAHVPPAFPLLLAGLYHVFGEGPNGVYAMAMTEATFLVALAAILPLISVKLGTDRMTGLIAALIALLGLRRNWLWEINYAGFALALAAWLACDLVRAIGPRETASQDRRNRPIILSLMLGLLWGALFLLHPGTVVIWVTWIVIGGIYAAKYRSSYVIIPALLTPLIMVTPWTWRNYRVLHSLVFIRSNLGLELSTGASSCAQATIFQNLESGCFKSSHPDQSREEATKLVRLGEAAYNRLKLEEAMDWIGKNPSAYLALTVNRFVYFWFPIERGSFIDALTDPRTRVSCWLVYLTTILSIPGAVFLWRKSRPGAIICVSMLATFPLIYYAIQFENRYRFPIMWVTFFLAAVAVREALRLLPFSCEHGVLSLRRDGEEEAR